MIKVYDAIMGSGKTTKIIEEIQKSPMTQKFIFITPLLSECHRIAGTEYETKDEYKRPIINDIVNGTISYHYSNNAILKDRLFRHPYFSANGSKAESLPVLLNNNDNIVSTHQLFANLTPSILEKAKDYILIIDEMLTVYEIYTEFKKEEIDAMFRNEWLSLADDTVTLVFNHNKYGTISENNIDPTKDTYYETFATLCDLGQLMLIDGKVVIWELASTALKSFKEVWIATYMFEGNLMSSYLKSHNIKYEVIKFGKKPSDIKNLINIYEDIGRSRLNDIGSKESALSSKNCEQVSTKESLAFALDNYVRNKAKCKKTDLLWTSFKHAKSKIQKNTIHNYTEQWLPLNTKATNDYADKHTVAYLCNIYPNPELVKASSIKGFSTNENVYALSEMVQFIWRSAIRNNKPINLYIPSNRMRRLLKDWLEDKYL